MQSILPNVKLHRIFNETCQQNLLSSSPCFSLSLLVMMLTGGSRSGGSNDGGWSVVLIVGGGGGWQRICVC